jgi:SNF2 family DNA or RNA helicase
MSVWLDAGFFRIGDEANSFLPSAAEIYQVIFEDALSIRGVAVSAADFQACGLEFIEYVADPYIILDAASGPDGPEIQCHFRVKSGVIEADVACDGDTLLDYAIGSGRWVPLPVGAVEEAQEILEKLEVKSFGRINLAQYMKLGRWRAQGITIEDRTANALSAPSLALASRRNPPKGFVGKLYGYQLDGFGWLSLMARNGLGGIIADEMGLGKTIQVICVLLEAKSGNAIPNLVIAPTTLMENWRRELARFAPSLNVLVHHGSQRTGFPSELSRHDVVISSFETTVMDVSLFRNVRWNLVVADEAQNIKNPQAKRTVQLKTIPRTCAVAVTGTPVENRLQDLWSITDFVLPSLLGPLAEFERRHPDTISSASLLEPVVSPLILRRTVGEVAGDLPERIDIPQPLEMDAQSATAYESIRSATAPGNTRGAGFAILQKLRMFCTHPWLTNHFNQVADAGECSVKMRRLFEIMEEVVASDGKAIIFTSYSGAVDLIQAEIATRFGVFVDAIDGRVDIRERQNKVDEFAAQKSSAVLVLNPKAAGVGLNITAANHVIHFNLEWNPAVEDQASARAHRRGQTRTVTVHRLFYTNTVEQIIDDRMSRKRDLARAAIVGTDGDTQDMDDVLRALRISPVQHVEE